MDDKSYPLTRGITYRGDAKKPAKWVIGFEVYGKGLPPELLAVRGLFTSPKLLAGEGDSITITLPTNLFSLCDLDSVGWPLVVAVDETGKVLFQAFGASKPSALFPFNNLVQLVNFQVLIFRLLEGPPVRKERGPDDDTQSWHQRIVELKDKKGLSWPQVKQQLDSEGWKRTVSAIRSAYREWKKNHQPC